MILYLGQQRAIRPNHSSDYPSRMMFLDTETTPTTNGQVTYHKFRLGWTRYLERQGDGGFRRERWTLYHDSLDVCRAIARKAQSRSSLYLFAHNAFFDLQAIGFFHHFARWGWSLRFIYDEGLSFILIIGREESVIKAVSTTNYFDFSLAQLGHELGLPKGEIDFATATDEQLAPYCHQDVAIASESVFRFMDFNRAHDCGRFALTRAAQALAAYRHRFMHRRIWIHENEEVKALERLAYFGGRTEAFRFGEVRGGSFVFLDVNSMYPFVMRRERYPSRLIGYDKENAASVALAYRDRASLVAEVTLETPEPIYAVRRDGKVIFPIGRFRAFVCTGAFNLAIDRRHLRAVHRVAVYETDDLFSAYVDYFYPLKARYKAEGNRAFSRMVKLYLNSLYGKFGERRPVEEWLEAPSVVDPYRVQAFSAVTGERWTETGMFGTVVLSLGKEEGTRSAPAIAAHVTEYARLRLWELIERAGQPNVIYCDTDSIVVPARLLPRFADLIDSETLGALSIDKRCETLTINGPKDYSLDGVRHCKGLPRKSKLVGVNTYTYDHFLGLAGHLRAGISDGVIVESVTKRIEPQYSKGTVLRSGRIVPYVFDGD